MDLEVPILGYRSPSVVANASPWHALSGRALKDLLSKAGRAVTVNASLGRGDSVGIVVLFLKEQRSKGSCAQLSTESTAVAPLHPASQLRLEQTRSHWFRRVRLAPATELTLAYDH